MAKLNVNKESIIKGIYNGTYNVTKLPKELYEATAEELKYVVDKGYGLDDMSDSDYDMLDDLTDNIFMFSAAKTFQQINEMQDALKDDDGDELDLAAFILAAGSIFDLYNDTWLDTEMDTAEWAARSASNWMDFTQSDVENPYLMYEAEIDGHTCEICEPLDGILIDMNDSFWDENATPQHFYCRCQVKEVTGIESEVKNKVFNKMRVSTQEQIKKAVEKSKKHKNPLFNYNPGKERIIFKDKGKNKHPYFIVKPKFKEFANNNFGLPMPQLKTT